MCEEMSHLLRNIRSIICIFEKYAKDDGDCGTLSKGELKQLIQTEFADVIVDPHDPKTIETVLHLLDTDCDGKVGFEEFTVLVFKVVKACYKKVQECQHTAGGPSKRDITNIQQRDIPPQQMSRDGPSQRDTSSTHAAVFRNLSAQIKKQVKMFFRVLPNNHPNNVRWKSRVAHFMRK
ncbi:cornulin-like [Notechis scutatus]|uniref:Cornulin-like n=1 Tax=Notechis scutatus TaxID=8663 RepID=A0A6J1VR67_9SAUR|nr:cornulin-like [Notechis scutatus]